MAKKFKFRLQSVEDVRKMRENEQLRLLASAQKKYQDSLTAKSYLLSKLEESLLRREKLSESLTPVLVFQIENENITGLKQQLVRADHYILKCKKNVEKALRDFLIARRQTRAIELLREKDFSEYKIKLKKKEAKELEDLYVMRSSQNMNNLFSDENSYENNSDETVVNYLKPNTKERSIA